MTAAVNEGIAYERISADDGAGYGVESQRIEINEHADEHGLTITEHFTDNDRSAYSGKLREDYARMLAVMALGVIRFVLVWHPDRLHRSNAELERFIALGRQHRIIVKSVTAGEYDLTTAHGRKALRDATTNAAYESEHRAERVALARKRQARMGAFGGGVRAFGWGAPTNRVRRVLVNKETREYEDRPVLDCTQHNPQEAAVIRWMADELLAGVPIAQVTRALNGPGTIRHGGKVIANGPVLTVSQADSRKLKREGKEVKHGGWNSKTVRQILTAPLVSGHAVYKNEIVARDVWDAILPEDRRQALITLFASETRTDLKTGKVMPRKTSPGNQPKWLGSLILECGICEAEGTPMTSRTKHGRPVYRCAAKGHGIISAEPMDKFLGAAVVERLSRPDAVDLVESAPEVDVNALRDEQKRLQGKKNGLVNLFNADAIDAEQLTRGTAELKARLAEIEAELSAAIVEDPLSDLVGQKSVRDAWEGLSLGRKREILRVLFTVTVKKGRMGVAGKDFDPNRVVITEARKPKAPERPVLRAA